MIAVIVLVAFRPESTWWAFTRFVLGRLPLRGIQGLRFAKILGSGHEGGFGLRPSATRQGLFCVFENESLADDFLDRSRLLAAYRARSQEFFTCKLQAYSSKGSWAGTSLPIETTPPDAGPIAALTRASIRPKKALEFWRNSPPAELSLAKAQGCMIAVGLGEAPIFRQATFSIWESVQAMDLYARTGAHMQAIKAAMSGQHFSESMFVRFRPISPTGTWKGKVFR